MLCYTSLGDVYILCSIHSKIYVPRKVKMNRKKFKLLPSGITSLNNSLNYLLVQFTQILCHFVQFTA
jgi:hypothetical protein